MAPPPPGIELASPLQQEVDETLRSYPLPPDRNSGKIRLESGRVIVVFWGEGAQRRSEEACVAQARATNEGLPVSGNRLFENRAKEQVWYYVY